MKYLANAFSLQMLPEGTGLRLLVDRLDQDAARAALSGGFASAIGHPDTAAVVGALLGRPVAVNRVSIRLTAADELYVAQYSGPRLPEGATSLPEGARIDFWLVRLDYD